MGKGDSYIEEVHLGRRTSFQERIKKILKKEKWTFHKYL